MECKAENCLVARYGVLMSTERPEGFTPLQASIFAAQELRARSMWLGYCLQQNPARAKVLYNRRAQYLSLGYRQVVPRHPRKRLQQSLYFDWLCIQQSNPWDGVECFNLADLRYFDGRCKPSHPTDWEKSWLSVYQRNSRQ